MKKRISVLVLALVLMLVATVSPALAQRPSVRVAGEVLDVDAALDQLTLKPLHRDEVTVQVTPDTELYRKVELAGLEPISFEDDIVIGDRVNVAGTWVDGVLEADRVVVVSVEPPPPLTIHGTILELEDDDQGTINTIRTIALERRDGDAVTVQTVLEETEFYRTVQQGRLEPITFDELLVGDWVRVQGAQDGEVFAARRVVVMPFSPPPPPRLVTGRIGAPDPTGAFTLDHPNRESVEVKTNEATEFFRTLRWGRLEPIEFDKLEVGDWVAVLGRWDGEGLEASKVIVMRGHGDGAEGVLEAGEVLEAEEIIDDAYIQQAQP